MNAYKAIGWKARVWDKGSFARVYVENKGRYIEIADGWADVSNMNISQAIDGAKRLCEEVGLKVKGACDWP